MTHFSTTRTIQIKNNSVSKIYNHIHAIVVVVNFSSYSNIFLFVFFIVVEYNFMVVWIHEKVTYCMHYDTVCHWGVIEINAV